MRNVVAGQIGFDLARPNCLQIRDVEPSIYASDEVEAFEDELLAGDEGDGIDAEWRHQAC